MDASVIVPTYNRAGLLEGTLQRLAAQYSVSSSFETIVSDDGSSDDTFDLVKSFERVLDLRYVYARDDGFRAARARNLGAGLASGDILLFCDSGVLPCNGWIAAHIQAHRQSARALVIGPVLGLYEDDPDRDPREVVLGSVGRELSALPAPWALAWTANISVRRKDFERVGGFDEAYQSWGCEDVDFALSLHQAGVAFAYSSMAAVHHVTHDEPASRDASNLINKQYLHSKFGLPETARFLGTTSVELNLEDIPG